MNELFKERDSKKTYTCVANWKNDDDDRKKVATKYFGKNIDKLKEGLYNLQQNIETKQIFEERCGQALRLINSIHGDKIYSDIYFSFSNLECMLNSDNDYCTQLIRHDAYVEDPDMIDTIADMPNQSQNIIIYDFYKFAKYIKKKGFSDKHIKELDQVSNTSKLPISCNSKLYEYIYKSKAITDVICPQGKKKVKSCTKKRWFSKKVTYGVCQ